jgi:hypothetical protein
MYDLRFIFDACGFGWVPAEVERELLYNVSFEPASGEVKLYVLDRGREFLHKISSDKTIVKQHRAQPRGADAKRLENFLGTQFDFNDVLLDTVEGEVCYLLIENSSPSEYNRLLNYLCLKYQISKSDLLAVVNRINKRPAGSMFECCANRAVSGVRVGMTGMNCKLYSRPFLTGNGFDLSENALTFLQKLYACQRAALAEPLKRLWVAGDLFSHRVVIVTQEDSLL